jgi:restriction endonuclease in pPIWI_RE module
MTRQETVTATGTGQSSPPSGPSQGPGLDGVALVRTVATALVRLSRWRDVGDRVYADGVQSAYNHLVLRAIACGGEPPASVPDMVTWAGRTPLAQWPTGLSTAALAEAGLGGAGFLVDAETRTPKQVCFEWAMAVPDVPAELFENTVIDEALARCRAAGAPEAYTAFRRLLITRPVLTVVELAALGAELDLVPVFELVRRCYEPVPAAYRGPNGEYRLCGRCGCVLIPLRAGGFRCELDRCRHDDRQEPDRIETAPGGLLQARRPLRVFITSPGLAETELEAALRGTNGKRGRRSVSDIEIEMWPAFDAYDLRLTFADGTAWAIDVKDWASPSLLGARTQAFVGGPPHDRALIVIPAYRFRRREDYARAFRHALDPGLKRHIEICTDADLVNRARREARRVVEAAHKGGR